MFNRIFLLIFLSTAYNAVAQKNSATLFFEPAITRLRLDVFREGGAAADYSYLFDLKKPNKPMYGYSSGILFGHFNQKRKIKMQVGFAYTVLRQHSGNFYGDRLNYPEVYGGVDLVAACTQFEIPVFCQFYLSKKRKKQKYYWGMNAGTSYSFLGQVRIEPQVISKITGLQKGSSVIQWLYPVENFNDLRIRLNNQPLRFSRISTSLGCFWGYNINRSCTIEFTPTIQYFSYALQKDLFKADALLFGLKCSTVFNF